jgi:glucose/arabinose dehydrogenase
MSQFNLKQNQLRSQEDDSNILQLETLEDRMMLSTVQIIAAGSENTETMQLQIDGSTVRTFNNVGGNAFAGNFVTYTHNTAGTISADQVRIRMPSDAYDPANGIDENLRIDAIVIDGVRYETEAPSTFSTGTWTAADGIVPGNRQSEFLHSTGYFQYAGGGGSTTSITVNARGSEGSESFALEVNGNRVRTWNNIATVFSSYTTTVTGNVTADQVRVVFLNDLFDEANGIDRNLLVDDIVVGGNQFESEASSTFSTGTWKPADGIVPGFRQSQTLHANGYFQFLADTSVNGGNFSLQNSNYTVSEGVGSVNVTVVRTGGSDGTVSLDYQTINGSAIAGQDYQARSGTLTFLDGQTSRTISIPIIDNSIGEADETFNIAIDNLVGNGNLLAPRTATVLIDDNDAVSGTGDGLFGEYFNNINLTNRIATRVDNNINFTWPGGPISGVGGDTFSVRWTGEIEARYSENYTFRTTSDDGVRLWINDRLVIDQWNDHAPTNHFGSVNLEAGVRNTIRVEFYENTGGAQMQLFWQSASQSFQIVPRSQLYAADDPGNPGDTLRAQSVVSGLTQPTSIDFSPDGRNMYISEKSGLVKVVRDGSLRSTPFIDIRNIVNNVRDRGLLDLAIHPDFENNPYIYLLFTYDPPEVFNNTGNSFARPDGLGNRAGRLIRVTANAATGYTTAVAGSEVVLLGSASTWNNFNGFVDSTNDFDEPPAGIRSNGTNIQDFIASDSSSHTVGAVEFSLDGSLFVSIGDGTSFNRVDPRTVRVQDIDNLSGKVLRIDPITGEGLSDNPFYNGNADANRSKVYQYGLRNPFRMTVDPATGALFVGDVGWTRWEEVNSAGAGANFGWPYFEGGNGTNIRTPQYENLPEAQAFYASGQQATPAVYGLSHQADGINAIVMGDVYRGSTYPAEYQGALFVNDLGQGIVRSVTFNNDGSVNQVRTFTTGAQIVVQMVQGPDGNMYYVDLNDNTVGRWVFV